jgi:pimeloyl-ACP methyl ester carboxylesterase
LYGLSPPPVPPMTPGPNIIVERGIDPTRLVIAFTGKAGELSIRAHDFSDLTGTLGQSRILLRDPSRLWYQKGTGDGVRSFPDIVDLLRAHIRSLGPERITIIGNSMGGFAAILAGHMLGADEVHAFAPQTSIHPLRLAWERDRLLLVNMRDLVGLLFTRMRHSGLLDLPHVLKHHNGRTRYFVHVCRGSSDAHSARRLASRAGVEVLPYPCPAHNVLFQLAKSGYLSKVLRVEPPDTARDLYDSMYGPSAKANGSRRVQQTELR